MKNKNKIRLLIDAVTIGSPGIFQLKFELLISIIKFRPEFCEIILLQNKLNNPLSFIQGCLIDNIKKPGWGWLGRWFWYQYILPNKIKEHNANVVYSLSGILSKSICSICGTVNTVNNMLPFHKDMINHYFFLSLARLKLLLLQKLYIKSSLLADSIILHSTHALKSISEFTGNLANKAFVVLTGIPGKFVFNRLIRKKHPYQNKPYFFYLSTIQWYKNHINLIKAYKIAFSKRIELPDLIIAGYPGDKNYIKKIENEIQKNNLNNHIKYIGVLPHEELPAWMYHTVINIFPSLCETNSVIQSEIIGMHGVMACSNLPPMPEVAGNAAEFFNPYDPDSIAKVILQLYNNKNLCKDLRRRAEKRANNLSWDNCGKVIWNAAEMAFEKFQLKSRKS